MPQRSVDPSDLLESPGTEDCAATNTIPKVLAKSYSSVLLFEEGLANSEEAFQLAQNARFLRVPRIVAHHRERLVIDFEYMEGWQTISRLIRDYDFLSTTIKELRHTFRLVGCTLAEYHALSGKIHGDFDTTNVLFKRNESQICLIDFSRPSFANRPDYYRGSIYQDLALFLIYLRVKYPPHQLYFAFRERNRILSKEFLEGYFEVSEAKYEFDQLQAEFRACLTIDYLARTFMVRFLRLRAIFNIEDLRQ